MNMEEELEPFHHLVLTFYLQLILFVDRRISHYRNSDDYKPRLRRQ